MGYKYKYEMIKKTFILLTTISLLGFNTKTDSVKDSATLKVISYNIWNGFEWGKDDIRKENFISWVNTQAPDVLALQELCGYTQEQLSKDARKWGHSYAKILKTIGYPVGITSTEPIEVKEKIMDNMHHGALHCKTASIDFFVIHFSPFSYKNRHEEASIILNKLSKVSENQNKYLVLGDFNALSPFDAHLYRDNDELLSSKRASEKKHDHVRNLIDGELEYGAIGSLLGFPLIDLSQKYITGWDDKVSCPTQVFETEKGEGRPETSTRIDYILASPFLAKQCINSRVLNKKDTYYLSDHYPVVAEFEL